MDLFAKSAEHLLATYCTLDTATGMVTTCSSPKFTVHLGSLGARGTSPAKMLVVRRRPGDRPLSRGFVYPNIFIGRFYFASLAS